MAPASYFMVFVRVRCRSLESERLEFGKPYLQTIMRLGRKESLERILAANGGTLLEKKWDKFDVALSEPPFVSTWTLSADGRFRMMNSSGELAGEFEVEQSVRARKGSLTMKSELSCPSGHVRTHKTEVSIGGGKKSSGVLENEVVYERVVPFWMESYLKDRVAEYNRRYVDNLKSCIESIVEE